MEVCYISSDSLSFCFAAVQGRRSSLLILILFLNYIILLITYINSTSLKPPSKQSLPYIEYLIKPVLQQDIPPQTLLLNLMGFLIDSNILISGINIPSQQLITIIVTQMSAQGQSQQIKQSHQSQFSSQVIHQGIQKPDAVENNPVELEFQKNYPKNIFIPLIEYLTELGYKEAYEKCVGTRSDFQGKNVVSLSSIYSLITQDWYMRNINKKGALAHISNKILINSKIKKKLFHILIAHLIFTSQYSDLKDFKHRVSKEANRIARRPVPQDDLFTHPNAIIYLLHVFLKILQLHASKKGYFKLQEELEKLSIEDAPPVESKNKNNGSKQEYKFYVKEIVHILSGRGLQAQSLNDIMQQTKQTILDKDKNLREKYQLAEGIPNWVFFVQYVIVRCFEHKRKDLKITNFIFNEWINECRAKMTNPFITQQKEKQDSLEQKNVWETGNITWTQKQFNFTSQKWSAQAQLSSINDDNHNSKSSPITTGKSKSFTPIILSKIDEK